MNDFKRNHYVPEWYQYRFINNEQSESKFYYLDLKPEKVNEKGHVYTRKSMLRWGPPNCFYSEDLYTTKCEGIESTEIEQRFFGNIDNKGRSSIELVDGFDHSRWSKDLFIDLLRYMSIQKLRTPKGLGYISKQAGLTDRNHVLLFLQEYQQLFCKTWMEGVWSIAEAYNSPTKLLLTDHPVTIYNKGCFPASKWCRGYNDPDVLFSGSHTIFPLSLNKLLILTNLSNARNPHGCPRKERPNPTRFGEALFDFREIQVGRTLSEEEVIKINYILKKRAYRYIAAVNKDWLFPENFIANLKWSDIGNEYLLMPDPREIKFSAGTTIRLKNGQVFAIDEYGRLPGQPGYNDESQRQREWQTFVKFQNEFERKFGQARRGQSYQD